jgi:hypothetical protein
MPSRPLIPNARRVCASAVALALAVGVAACGSSSSTSSSNAASSTSSQTYQARLNLAKCFRAHGINVPDPSASGGPAGGGGEIFRSLQNYSQAQVDAARQACQQYISKAFPRLNLTPAQRAQVQQQLVKFAQCMRSHGINIPDPQISSGGGFGFRQAFRSIDRNSPAFQAANKACASLRPKFGRGGPGAPAGAATSGSGGAPNA